MKFVTLWQSLVVGIAMAPQSYVRKTIYIDPFGYCCFSDVLYLNLTEHCSPNYIFSAILSILHFSLDHLCRFLHHGFLFLS